jgi:hypothetical protein
MTTLRPSAAKASDTAEPTTPAAPVTSASFPVKSFMAASGAP